MVEGLLQSIHALSGTTDADLKQLHEQLKAQAPALANTQPDVLLQAAQSLDSIEHALGVLFLL